MGIYGTQQSVWLMYFHPTDGLSFDRIGADTSYAHNPLGAGPQADANLNGFGAFSVSPDDRHVWAIWDSLVGATPSMSAQSYWNGTAWVTIAEPPAGDSWGIGSSLYWEDGVAATRLDGWTFEISVSTISGGD